MIRILAAIGMTLLVATPALAQSYCAQVRQGVATYGYSAARRYALAHYGKEAVRYADRCLRGAHHQADMRRHYHYRYHPHYRYHHHYHSHYTR